MIITNNEDALRVKCELVSEEEVGQLISILESELKRANDLGKGGIGLAAPQIGIAKNIAIVRLPRLNLDLVNCYIEKQYDSFIFRNEGCLSFPGRVEDTLRYKEIYVKNNLVYPHSFVATDLLSVVCQHELDHVNSTLFYDKKNSNNFSSKLKLGPNDPCICNKLDPLTGKVRKYKKCCGK